MSIVTSNIFCIFLIRGLLPAAVILCVDQIVVNHLHLYPLPFQTKEKELLIQQKSVSSLFMSNA